MISPASIRSSHSPLILLATLFFLIISNVYAVTPTDDELADLPHVHDKLGVDISTNDEQQHLPLPFQIPSHMKIGVSVEDYFKHRKESSSDQNQLQGSNENEEIVGEQQDQQQHSDQQILNLNPVTEEERKFYKGKILYIEARAILNTLPDVPNPDNIGRYYRPRRTLWSVFYDGAYQSICNFILSPVPEAYRYAICGVSPTSDLKKDNTHLQTITPFSLQSRTLLSLERQKQLNILDSKKLELKRAFELLTESSELGNKDALFTRAEFYFYGNYTHKQDFYESYKLYHELADISGNTTAQFMLGMMYSTGMFGSTPQDQARANLYYTFAAEAGDYRAKMAIGYRHFQGIATPKNLKIAALYFKDTAKIAYQNYVSGPPGGRHLTEYSWLLSDKDGGVLGEGASKIKPVHHYPILPPSSTQSFDMAVRYLDYLSLLDESAVVARYALALLHYKGDIVVDPKYSDAVKYAKECTQNPPDIYGSNYYYMCCGFLGLRYMRGEGIEQDFSKAHKWLEIGYKNGDYISAGALGFMYLEGLGVEKNEDRAMEIFKSNQDSGFTHFNMGRIYLRKGDLNSAYLEFDKASKSSEIGGLYHQGMMLYQGSWGKEADAAPYFQLVSERIHDFHCPLRWAHKQYDDGDFGSALLGFMIAAEEGYQEAQLNAAYMLDDQRSAIDIGRFVTRVFNIKPFLYLTEHAKKLMTSARSDTESTAKEFDSTEHTDFGSFSYQDPTDIKVWKRQKDIVAFTYWTRLANSFNVDALVKVGDYFLYGVGVKPNPNEAATRYQIAADYNSAIARWNLGWMYENGIGVEQDFHLAKRYYDTAAVVKSEAYFPVSLSLIKLRARSYYNSWRKPPSDHTHNTFGEPESDNERDLYIGSEKPKNILDDKGDRPKSFREGLAMFWKKWKESGGFNPDLDRDARSERSEEDLEAFGDDEFQEINMMVDNYLMFVIVLVVGWYAYRNWRRNAQAQEQEQARNPFNPPN